MDANQLAVYELAHATAGVETAAAVVDDAEHGPVEERLASAFVAEAAYVVAARLLTREEAWGLPADVLDVVPPVR